MIVNYFHLAAHLQNLPPSIIIVEFENNLVYFIFHRNQLATAVKVAGNIKLYAS